MKVRSFLTRTMRHTGIYFILLALGFGEFALPLYAIVLGIILNVKDDHSWETR